MPPTAKRQRACSKGAQPQDLWPPHSFIIELNMEKFNGPGSFVGL